MNAKAAPDFIARSGIGDTTAIVLRPEDIGLSAEGRGLPAALKSLTFLGDCYDIGVEVAGQLLRVKTRKRPVTQNRAVFASPLFH